MFIMSVCQADRNTYSWTTRTWSQSSWAWKCYYKAEKV
jgi:hypothetical protein